MIELEPVPGECVSECGKLIQTRAYYMAHSTNETLELLDQYELVSSSDAVGFELFPGCVEIRQQLLSSNSRKKNLPASVFC